MLLEGGKLNDIVTFVNMKNRKNELDDLIKNIPDRVLKLPSGFFWLLILKYETREIGFKKKTNTVFFSINEPELSGFDNKAICYPHTLLLANDSEKLKIFSELRSNSGHCQENTVLKTKAVTIKPFVTTTEICIGTSNRQRFL